MRLFSKLGGLVPAIAQDVETRQILMVGFMNKEVVEKTLEERKAIFWSRSRQRLWKKGETSGNFLNVVSVDIDCDGDALLVKVKPDGPACHAGSFTCFGEAKVERQSDVLYDIEQIIRERKARMPEHSYTTNLFRGGKARIAQKVGEEAVEVVVAAMSNEPKILAEESADLLYHLLVLLQANSVGMGDVLATLKKRMANGGGSESVS